MSRRFKLILAAVGIVVVALLAFFLLINPIRGEIDDLRTQIDAEKVRIQKAEDELRLAEQTEREGRKNQARMLELAKMIPRDPEVPSLILQVQDLADKAGIDWIQIAPGEPQPVEGLQYAVVPLSLSFSGSFYDVTDFMYRSEQMVAGPGRLLTVKTLSLTPEDVVGRNVTLAVRMTMYAFVMQGVGESPAPAESSGGSGSTTSTENTQ